MSPFDKRQVREAFDRAAPRYDAAAVLQREVGGRLLERLDLIRRVPDQILDLGSGTGWCSEALARRYPKAAVTAFDLAPAMVAHARRRFSPWQRWRRGHRFICGDAERLPFGEASFDLVFSNLTLQWCQALDATFAELRRVLRPGGLVMFTSLGPDTLRELRAAWAAVDAGVHVNEFLDMHDVGDALVRARLADPVMDVEQLTLTYREVGGLMRDLKDLGAHNLNAGRPAALTGKGRLRAMTAAYERHRRPDGLLPATWEVVYGHAWAPDTAPQARGPGGEIRVPLTALRRG